MSLAAPVVPLPSREAPSGRPLLVYHPDYLTYRFSADHALREVRGRLARDLIASILAPVEERAPSLASEDAILGTHQASYVKVVKRLSKDPVVAEPDFGLGPGDNPPFAGMYDAARLQVGGTLLACEEVRTGRFARAYNLGGGFHHAMPDRASGFCIFNDIAIGIRHLLATGVRRILYVDIDGHHGDGVQDAFYRDPRVLTISLHEDGRFLFPGTGFADEIGEGEGKGYAVNVPLPPRTRDAGWTNAFDAIVPPLAEAFRPEVLVTQTGADAHTADPLTHLELTTESYEHAGARFDEIARRLCSNRWIAVGGGGYDVTTVPRVWALLYAAMVRRRPGNALPEDWRRECRRLVRAEPKDGTLRDASHPAEEAAVSRAVAKVIDEVQDHVFPIHSLR